MDVPNWNAAAMGQEKNAGAMALSGFGYRAEGKAHPLTPEKGLSWKMAHE